MQFSEGHLMICYQVLLILFSNASPLSCLFHICPDDYLKIWELCELDYIYSTLVREEPQMHLASEILVSERFSVLKP